MLDTQTWIANKKTVCPKCDSRLYNNRDVRGDFRSCLMCGYEICISIDMRKLFYEKRAVLYGSKK